jgi:hypothetical protein
MLLLSNGKYEVRFYYDVPVGTTTCKVTTKTAEFLGVSLVSVHDQFNRIIGRKIALTRALVAAGVSKEERRQIFIEFFTKTRMV